MNPLRSVLLGMADSPTWKRLLTGWGVTRRVVARFIPGETLDEALAAARRLNEAGMVATLNPLGEHVSDEATATAATDDYLTILDRIASDGLDSNVSVKLSLLGLDLGREIAIANARRVLETARRHGNFVRIDMEDSTYVDPTLDIFEELRPKFPELGVVIQSYLRRSLGDIERLVALGAPIRVVKGAYSEPPDIAFPDKADVDECFARILRRLAEPDARDNGVRVAVATHDDVLIDEAKGLMNRNGIEEGWEFQMLYGIGRDLQEQLVVEGHTVRIYISYGVSWYPWFMRRLAERPANVGFFLRHLFR